MPRSLPRCSLKHPVQTVTLVLAIAVLASQHHREATADDSRKPRLDLFGDPLPKEALARMSSGRMRHPGSNLDLTFSPDGKALVSSAGNGVRIWGAATGKLRRRIDVASDWVLSFAFTSEGILVASAGLEKRIVTLQLFDPASGKVRRRIDLPDRAATGYVTLSRDGKWLAYTHQNNILLIDSANGREVLSLPRANLNCIAFAPDGKTAAICDYSDTIRIHNLSDGKCTRRLKHEGDHVAIVAIAAKGRYLVSIPSNDNQDPGQFSIWDLQTGAERHRLRGADKFVLRAAFSPDEKYLAVGCAHTHLLLFDVATGKEVRRYPTDAYFASIAFSPDGKALAATSGIGTIRLWDTATGRVRPASADPYLDSVDELRFSDEGRRLLGKSGIHFAWEPHTGRELLRFPKVSEHNWFTALSPDESLLAAFDGPKGTIRLWDAKTGRQVRALKGYDKWVYYCVFSPDGRRLISSSGEDGIIRIWDVAGGREIGKLCCAAGVTFLTVSPDGLWLASSTKRCGPDGYEVVLWDLRTGQEKMHFPMTRKDAAFRLAFSPDSQRLAAVSRGSRDGPGVIAIKDLTGEQKSHFLLGHKGWVGSIAFSPNNRTLATGDRKGEVFLWEMASKRPRHRFIGHESWIKALAFSPDGRLLASSSYEAPVYVWDVRDATDQLHRSLSEMELKRAWAALAGEDASAAFTAIRRLSAAPKQTLPFIQEHLKPVAVPDRKHLRQLVTMLDSDDFATRQKAAAELEKQADVAAATLRQILAKEKPALEIRKRLLQIVESIENRPESLRAVRAVEVLEWIATPDAVSLLGELANGAAEARLTREAAAARKRLRR